MVMLSASATPCAFSRVLAGTNPFMGTRSVLPVTRDRPGPPRGMYALCLPKGTTAGRSARRVAWGRTAMGRRTAGRGTSNGQRLPRRPIVRGKSARSGDAAARSWFSARSRGRGLGCGWWWVGEWFGWALNRWCGVNRPGFDAASFLAKDADHGEEVSHRAAGARDPDGG